LDSQTLKVRLAPSRVLLMGLFFPTFASGPIAAVQTFKQLPPETRAHELCAAGMRRIFLGLVRKVAFADALYGMVIAVWLAAGVESLAPYQAVLLPVCLGFYVYWDFAGYSDIAIGTAMLLGYSIPENFNKPYLSVSLVEFWRRWHITLSEWIRVRLMMKMVGRRSPTYRLYAATILSMALCGLWHGAGLNFLVWGLWHGVGLVGVHIFGEMQRRSSTLFEICQSFPWQLISVLLTFSFVTAGWLVFFLSADEALVVVQRAVLWRPSLWTAFGVVALACSAFGLRRLAQRVPAVRWEMWPRLVRGTAISIAAALLAYVTLLRGLEAQQFVYTQF
jgi:alginate O-acetyltransferase complex protein AlgI